MYERFVLFYHIIKVHCMVICQDSRESLTVELSMLSVFPSVKLRLFMRISM